MSEQGLSHEGALKELERVWGMLRKEIEALKAENKRLDEVETTFANYIPYVVVLIDAIESGLDDAVKVALKSIKNFTDTKT